MAGGPAGITDHIDRLDGPTGRMRLEQHRSQLHSARSSFEARWREIEPLMSPGDGRFDITEPQTAGKNAHYRILDNRGEFASDTAAAGIASGLTSPARPWFVFMPPEREMLESQAIREWLDTASHTVLKIMAGSNSYRSLPKIYKSMAVFGTGAMFVDEHPSLVINTRSLPIGSYYLDTGADGMVNTYFREMQMTCVQLVEQFGIASVSPQVRSSWSTGNYTARYDVVHCIFPRSLYRGAFATEDGKPFVEVYYEKGHDSILTQPGRGEGPRTNQNGAILSSRGYMEFPVMAPRWKTTGEDVYGRGPGWSVLGSTRSLMLKHRRVLQAMEKEINPALVGPTMLREQGVSLMPGTTNFIDVASGAQGLRPVHEVKFAYEGVLSTIVDNRQTIDEAFYADLFLLLANTDRREITATEVQAKQEERLLQLGPVYQNLTSEATEPFVQRVFAIANRRGLIPEPPEELRGEELNIEYTGILAQAMRLSQVSSTERLVGYAAQVSQVPGGENAMDKIDIDQSIDEMGWALSASPKVLRDDEQVAEIRRQRAEQAEAAQAMEMAAQAAQTAESLSNTQTTGQNALTELLSPTGA